MALDITNKAKEFWSASSIFRMTCDVEARHRARVSLMILAVEENSIFSDRAADLLLTEGLAIVSSTPAAVMRI